MDESEEKQDLYYDLRDEIRKIDDSLSKLRDHLLDVIDAKWDGYAESKKIEDLPTVKDMKTFVDKINSAHKSKTLHYDYYNTRVDKAAHFEDLFRTEKSEFETFFDVDFISVLDKMKNEDLKMKLRSHNRIISKIKSCSQKDADELSGFLEKINELIEKNGYLPIEEYTAKLNEITNKDIKAFLLSFKDARPNKHYFVSPALRVFPTLCMELSKNKTEKNPLVDEFIRQLNELLGNPNLRTQEIQKIFDGNIRAIATMSPQLHKLVFNYEPTLFGAYRGTPARQETVRLYMNLLKDQNKKLPAVNDFIQELGKLASDPDISINDVRKMFNENMAGLMLMPPPLRKLISNSELLKMKTDQGESLSLPELAPKPQRTGAPVYNAKYENYQSTKRKETKSEISALDAKVRSKRKNPVKSENILKLRKDIEKLLSPIKDNDYGRTLRHGLLGVYENIEKIKGREIKLDDIKKIVDVIVEKNIPFNPADYKEILKGAKANPSLYADNAIPSYLKDKAARAQAESKTQSPKSSAVQPTVQQPRSLGNK